MQVPARADGRRTGRVTMPAEQRHATHSNDKRYRSKHRLRRLVYIEVADAADRLCRRVLPTRVRTRMPILPLEYCAVRVDQPRVRETPEPSHTDTGDSSRVGSRIHRRLRDRVV